MNNDDFLRAIRGERAQTDDWAHAAEAFVGFKKLASGASCGMPTKPALKKKVASPDFSVALAQREPTEEENLEQALRNLPSDEISSVAQASGLTAPAPQLHSMQEKMAAADLLGRQLAREDGGGLKEKIAYLRDPYMYGGYVPSAHETARAMTQERALGKMTPEQRAEHNAVNTHGTVRTLVGGGLGAVGGGLLGAHAGMVGNGALLGGVLGAGGGALYHHLSEGKEHNQKLREIAYGQEKKAGLLSNVGQKLMGAAIRNPSAALGVGGAAVGAGVGAATAQPGQRMSGAMSGAAIGGLAGGVAGKAGLGKTLQQGVLGTGKFVGKPMLGQGVADYAKSSLRATSGANAGNALTRGASGIQTTGNNLTRSEMGHNISGRAGALGARPMAGAAPVPKPNPLSKTINLAAERPGQ